MDEFTIHIFFKTTIKFTIEQFLQNGIALQNSKGIQVDVTIKFIIEKFLQNGIALQNSKNIQVDVLLKSMYIITNYRSERSFFFFFSGNSTRLGPNWTKSARLSGFRKYESHNLKHESTDAHFSNLQLIKFLKQFTKPCEHEICPKSENFQHFFNKLTFLYSYSDSFVCS